MKIKIMKSLLSAAILAAMSNGAYAAGTAAGTPVNNTATISYSVGTISQTDILSSPDGLTPTGAPTTFVVDKKIDLTVSEGSDASVTPGQSGANITFTLRNTGNSTEFFKLSETQVGNDNFDASSCTISAAAPATAGTGADTYELVPDTDATVTVSCDIPLTPTNSQTSNVDLSATAVTDTTGATAHTESASDTAGGVEVVLADANATAGDADTTDGAARNATHSAVNSYVVSTAALTVTKAQPVVTAMPINGADDLGDTNFHIPGATVRYTITVANAAAEATHLTITDVVPANLTYVAASCALTGDGVVNAVAPNPALGCSESGGTVSSSSFTLPAGPTSATLTFDATVD